MTQQFYSLLHMIGLMLLFFGLGGVATLAMVPSSDDAKRPARRVLVIAHGLGLALMLVAGFGLLAKLGITGSSWPTWLLVKLVLWLAFGASVVLFRRLPHLSRVWIILLVVLGALAGYLGGYKPPL